MLTLRQYSTHCRNRSNTIPSHVDPLSVHASSVARPCATSALQAGRPAQRRTAVAALQPAPQQLPEGPTDKGQAHDLKVNVSKRQLLVFGCACCLSLQTQQSQPAAADSGHFAYTGAEGPTHWSGTCGSGLQQSPINISLQQTACDTRPAPDFKYLLNNSVTVKNTGTTVQVDFQPGSNTIRWAGKQLALLQYHFHTPSEHTVEGAHSSMEAHLVHRDLDTGGLAVLAVLLEAPPAYQQQPAPSPSLAAALAAVPRNPGDSGPCSTPVNPADLLPIGPDLQQYVSYRGSLTTPPCSEGVDWLVWMQPVAVPQQQVQAFKAFAGMNARPVQPLNERGLATNCLATV